MQIDQSDMAPGETRFVEMVAVNELGGPFPVAENAMTTPLKELAN